MTLIEPAVSIRGAIEVPGVKGICQRGVLLGAVADGVTEVRGFGRAADTQSAIDVVRQLGVEVTDVSEEVVRVDGVGLRGLRARGAARLRERRDGDAAPGRASSRVRRGRSP